MAVRVAISAGATPHRCGVGTTGPVDVAVFDAPEQPELSVGAFEGSAARVQRLDRLGRARHVREGTLLALLVHVAASVDRAGPASVPDGTYGISTCSEGAG